MRSIAFERTLQSARVAMAVTFTTALMTLTTPTAALAVQEPEAPAAQNGTGGTGSAVETAPAQSPDVPAPAKRVTITAGIDFATAYLFRGIRQEDHGAIVPPFVDLGVNLYEGEGALKAITVNGGNWNSLHSGPSGHSGQGNAWYEADYYASTTFTFGRWKPGALFTSYTSPNDAFGTVHEIAGTLAYDDSGSAFPLAPKVTLAFEVHGQADGGLDKGTYLELGIRPIVPLTAAGKYPVSVAVPLKLGLSLKDYYEGPTGNNTFGYFDTGLIASVPLAFMGSAAAWEVHGGVDFLWLGDNMRLLNNGDRIKPVGIMGISVTY